MVQYLAKLIPTLISLHTQVVNTNALKNLSDTTETMWLKLWAGNRLQMEIQLGSLKTLGVQLGVKMDMDALYQMEKLNSISSH